MTQYDKIRVGKGADKKYLHYKDIVPLADLNDIVFGTWDVYPQNAYQAAMYAEVLKEKDINPVREELEQIVPMKAAFDKNYAKRLDGDNVKDCKTRWGDGRGAAPGHPRLQGEARLLTHRRSMGCIYRNLRTCGYGDSRHIGSSRGCDEG